MNGHMKTVISIGKEVILFIILLALGSLCFINGLIGLQKEKNAIPLSKLSPERCRIGQFVVGEITSYVNKDMGNGSYSGESGTLFTGGKEYYFYTIPIDNNYYIRIMLVDKSIVRELEEFSRGKGDAIYFEGQIIKSPTKINYQWYEDIEEFKNIGTDSIIAEYVVKEIHIQEKTKILYMGIFLLILSFVQFRLMGGLSAIICTEDAKEKEPDKGIQKIYNIENELMAEKRHLLLLNKKMSELKKGCLYRIFLLAAGAYIFGSNYYWEIKFIGVIVVVISLRGIIKYILNSGNKCMEWIMRLFNKESIALQINHSKNRISAMENNKES